MYRWRIQNVIALLIVLVATTFGSVTAFQLGTTSTSKDSTLYHSTRREFFEKGSLASIATIVPLMIGVLPQEALASGGATAGGAYLLSVCTRKMVNILIVSCAKEITILN
jgi:hypothetical protein